KALDSLLVSPTAKQKLLSNVKFAWEKIDGADDVYYLYTLLDESRKGKTKLDGDHIIDAAATYDEKGKPSVSMNMDNEGATIWRKMTEAAAQNKSQIAIVLDDEVISAPFVDNPISGGRSSITFNRNASIATLLAEAQDLAGLLKAGSLPAGAKIVDEVSVGATLGDDNIKRGLTSFIVALLVVLLYMIFYYKGAGLVSDIALIANLFFLIGALGALHASLTLPGIAGIVLTIGMAVDANVLIYERIKEEMRNGKGLALAVKDGYKKAYSAIIDANITTLLTAIVLKIFGSGPILGFANTLIIGIFTSLFSAIVITRLIFFSRLEGKKAISFYTRMTKDWFTNTNFQFVKKRKMFYGLSAVIIIAGIVSLSTRGLKQGVDFSGGTSVDVEFKESIDVDKLRVTLADALTENGTKGNPIVQSKETDREYRITTNFMMEADDADVDEKINAALDAGFSPLGEYEITRYNKVDGNISDDFRRGAGYATIFALLVIFLYLVFRFRKWQFGLGALIAMIHDVLIVLSLFSIFWGRLPFTMEIDQAFIAAILTVIGYSINDTVVVFDRVREYIGLFGKKKDDAEIINSALNSTLSRTINTSVSTFIVLLIIFLFGGDNIKGFVFALMTGVVVGTYSSIFIATPSVLDFSKRLTKEA
ncbi:MAG: protein translocase subunit SecD, partial [Flavobacteriales bacterium]